MRERFGNLNHEYVRNNQGDHDPLEDFGAQSRYLDGRSRVAFRDVRGALLECIERWPIVYGCVAWVTDYEVIAALGRKRSALIIQKEDFLRPDSGRVYKAELRNAYDQIGGLTRINFPAPLWPMSLYGGDEEIGVRCVGYARRGDLAVPRMHHKFLVFAESHPFEDDVGFFNEHIAPRAVWTGSFNFTHNGTQSLENGIYIEDEQMGQAFAAEFAQVAGLSEPLDWEHEYVAPEWSTGT